MPAAKHPKKTQLKPGPRPKHGETGVDVSVRLPGSLHNWLKNRTHDQTISAGIVALAKDQGWKPKT